LQAAFAARRGNASNEISCKRGPAKSMPRPRARIFDPAGAPDIARVGKFAMYCRYLTVTTALWRLPLWAAISADVALNLLGSTPRAGVKLRNGAAICPHAGNRYRPREPLPLAGNFRLAAVLQSAAGRAQQFQA